MILVAIFAVLCVLDFVSTYHAVQAGAYEKNRALIWTARRFGPRGLVVLKFSPVLLFAIAAATSRQARGFLLAACVVNGLAIVHNARVWMRLRRGLRSRRLRG